MKISKILKIIIPLLIICVICNCVSQAASAQEYFSIGMAYYELGKYEEAEKWLNRAKMSDRTMTASQYNLGRLAFETQRYEEAAKHFEGILKIDPDNVLALKAAAYSRIKTGDISAAEKHYRKLLSLVPESADDGYNHALVLYAMERYAEAEEALANYPFSIEENNDTLLLYARSQKAQGKVEAIDNYAKYLASNSNADVRYEYAQLLEKNELYARALEEYKLLLSATDNIKKDNLAEMRFSYARLLLIADGASAEGITVLQAAIGDGFSDIEAVEELQKNTKVSAANRDTLRGIVNDMQRKAESLEQEKSKNNESTNQP